MSAGKLGRVTGLVLVLAAVVGGADALGNGAENATGGLTAYTSVAASQTSAMQADDIMVSPAGIEWV